MKYERDGLLLPVRDHAPLDADLFESFQDAMAGAPPTYEQLKLDTERSRQITDAWHRGEDADLSADHVDEADLADRLARLRGWKAGLIARDDLDPTVKRLYRWKVNEEIANVYMVQASAKGDAEGFRRWNEFVYGKPDESVYRAALDWIGTDADRLAESEHESVRSAAATVLSLIEGKRGDRQLLIPDPETFERVRQDHMRPMGHYSLLLAGVDRPDGKVTTEMADPILRQVLTNIGSEKDIKDASGASWSVTADAILRPAAMNMVPDRFIGLGLGHEVTHELERVNGARGPINLAAEGLDRYESGNEGRAVTREQVVYETFDDFGKLLRWRDILRRHIAISYAAGVAEDGPVSSAKVYEFVNAIDTMYQVRLKPLDLPLAHEAAQSKTDALLLRVLKGTNGRGGAFLKDKVYAEGHVAVWLQAARRGSDAISQGDLGKFDIANDRHLEALREVGLLPMEQADQEL